MMARSWLQFVPRKIPVVGVRIGTSRHKALVDTGAAISMVAPEVALKLGMASTWTYPIVGISGQRQTPRTVQLPGVGFGNVELQPRRAAVVDLAPLGLSVEIILGVNALYKHRLQFDFIEGRIYIMG